MTTEFKPSQLRPFARSYVPLIATFNHSESEGFAAMMIGACKFHGDTWQALEPKQIGEWLKQALETDEHWKALNGNPFFRPHPQLLVKEGFARFTNGDNKHGPIEFTKKGFEALRQWVRSPIDPTAHAGTGDPL